MALQRPKLTWMPLPEPGPALLLFWIRLNLTSVGLTQVESNSMPEMLFWTMLLSIWWPPCVPEKPGLVQIPDKKQGSLKVEPCTVNPSSTTLSAIIWTGPQGWLIIDSLVGTRVRASTSLGALEAERFVYLGHLFVISARRDIDGITSESPILMAA